MTELNDDRALGVQHRHEWQPVSRLPQLQSAHDRMRWDVSKSRILSVEICAVCDQPQPGSVAECAAEACTTHPICSRPYR